MSAAAPRVSKRAQTLMILAFSSVALFYFLSNEIMEEKVTCPHSENGVISKFSTHRLTS